MAGKAPAERGAKKGSASTSTSKKSAAASKGKGKQREREPTQNAAVVDEQPAADERPFRLLAHTEGHYAEEEDADSSGSDLELERADPDAPAVPRQSFVTASSGDAYLLHSARPSKTADTLLSSSIDPAFSLSSYAASLAAFDSRRTASPRPLPLPSRHTFSQWSYELSQGYSLALYGFGSKRRALNAFAEYARASGDCLIVNGFDPAVVITDVLLALEVLLIKSSPLNEGQGNDSDAPPRAKKQKTAAPPVVAAAKTQQLSPIEGRARRVCEALSRSTTHSRPVHLIIHNLDLSAPLCAPKSLAVLALLAAHPRLHLTFSIDHIRAPLLFPSSLSHARPTPIHSPDSRALNLLYHPLTTLAPYTTEVSTSHLLSSLLPSTVFPRLPSSTSTTSASPTMSAIYTYGSVVTTSQNLFKFLAELQGAATDAIPSSIVRATDLNPPLGQPSPRFAITLDNLTKGASEALIAIGGSEKIEALLSEFRDHGVVRSGVVPPDDGESDEVGTWLWIALTPSEMEEVLKSIK
ncbi:hypothetical protein RQP46_011488 [Phenoliferia psychrophenolica]